MEQVTTNPVRGTSRPSDESDEAVVERQRLAAENSGVAEPSLMRAESNESRFKTIFEHSPQGLAMVDPHTGRLLEANPALCAILGREEASLVGATFRDISNSDDMGADDDNMRKLMSGETDTFTMERRYLLPDSTPVWVSLTVASVRLADGSVSSLVGIVEDITERRKREQDAQHAELEVVDAQMSTIFALAKLAESRDDEAVGHMERIQDLCRILAEEMRSDPAFAGQIDDDFITHLCSAAPLHDVGKVGVPDNLLRPGRLTASEFDILKTHALIGAKTLSAVRDRHPGNAFIRMGADLARSHHEHWDGTGYPDGLLGEEIPLAARILAVADVYDAIRSVRVYKEARSHAEAMAILGKGAGIQFDPLIVEAMRRASERVRALRPDSA